MKAFPVIFGLTLVFGVFSGCIGGLENAWNDITGASPEKEEIETYDVKMESFQINVSGGGFPGFVVMDVYAPVSEDASAKFPVFVWCP